MAHSSTALLASPAPAAGDACIGNMMPLLKQVAQAAWGHVDAAGYQISDEALACVYDQVLEILGAQAIDFACCECTGFPSGQAPQSTRVFALLVDGRLWGRSGPTSKVRMESHATRVIERYFPWKTTWEWTYGREARGRSCVLGEPIAGRVRQQIHLVLCQQQATEMEDNTPEATMLSHTGRL